MKAYSLDEASLDITTHLFEHPGKTAEDTATEIRKAIQAYVQQKFLYTKHVKP